jgi:hypothetical protein
MTPTKNESLPELRGLVTQWRHNAQGCGRRDQHAAGTWRSCARELEAALTREAPKEGVLDRPARVAGRDFAAGQSVRQVIGRAQAHYEVHHEGCLRHPHTGELRDYRDVESDPDGTLCVGPGPLEAATPPAPQRLAQGDAYDDGTGRDRDYSGTTQPPHHDRGEVELPEPYAYCDKSDTNASTAFMWRGFGQKRDSLHPLYTAEQMRAALSAAKPQEASIPCDHCDGIGEFTEPTIGIIRCKVCGGRGSFRLSSKPPQVEAKRQTGGEFVLVPREPTEEMLAALMHEWDSTGRTPMADNYRAMIAAAAKPSGEETNDA